MSDYKKIDWTKATVVGISRMEGVTMILPSVEDSEKLTHSPDSLVGMSIDSVQKSFRDFVEEYLKMQELIRYYLPGGLEKKKNT